MEARLLVKTGAYKGNLFEIPSDKPTIFGRSDECTYSLPDAGISRRHFQIDFKDNFFILTDLKSTNGTFINGKKAIDPSPLQNGDIISAGECIFVFHIVSPIKDSDTKLVQIEDDSTTQTIRLDSTKYKILDSSLFVSEKAQIEKNQDVKRVYNALSAIYKISNLINQEIKIKRIFDVALDSIISVTQAERGVILLYDESSGDLQTAVYRLKSDVTTDSSFKVSSSIVNECLKGQVIICKDVLLDERFKKSDSVLAQNIRSVLCVPMLYKEKVIGIIYLDTISKAEAFTAEDLEMAIAISGYTTTAVIRSRLVEELENLFYESVRAIVAALEAKDIYTFGHSERVTSYAMTLGRELGLPEPDLDTLFIAGLLHDVGKIGIPESILLKPTLLTEEERAIMNKHPVIGADMIGHIKNTEKIICGIKYHHERFDGTGYPERLKGDKIPRDGRILALADAFDAMTSDRPYRKKLTLDQTLDEFKKNTGIQFDPDMAKVFISCIETGKIKPLLITRPKYIKHYAK